MEKSLFLTEVIEHIIEKEKGIKTRKVMLKDLIDESNIKTTTKNIAIREAKVVNYRMQMEYGEKKFIKP